MATSHSSRLGEGMYRSRNEYAAPSCSVPVGSPVPGSLDDAVPGIGRVLPDTADLERSGVHPRAVDVAVHEEHRSVRDERIELFLPGGPAGEQVHGPATADDPVDVGVLASIGGDDPAVILERMDVLEIDANAVQARGGWMTVGILEAGDHQPPIELDRRRPGSGQRADLLVGAHRQDATLFHGDGLRPRRRRVAGVDGTTRQDEIRASAHSNAHRAVGTGSTDTISFGNRDEVRAPSCS